MSNCYPSAKNHQVFLTRISKNTPYRYCQQLSEGLDQYGTKRLQCMTCSTAVGQGNNIVQQSSRAIIL